MLLACLILLSAAVLTLEIQRRLVLARLIGALLMLMVWQFCLSPELQLKAASCAVVYHGMAEGVRQWQQNFPCVFEHRKDGKLVLWLLFWARMFIWGATVGGVAILTTVIRRQDDDDSRMQSLASWQEAAVLALYYEVVEVLVMLYFSDQELPYVWHKRIGHWVAALVVGFLERSGQVDAVLRGPVLVGMSPLALVGVLLMVMWLSMAIPWDQIAKATSPSLSEEEEEDDKMEALEWDRGEGKDERSVSRVQCSSS